MILYFTQFKCRKNSLLLQCLHKQSSFFFGFFELLHFRVVNFNDEDTVLGKTRQNKSLYTALKSFTEPTCLSQSTGFCQSSQNVKMQQVSASKIKPMVQHRQPVAHTVDLQSIIRPSELGLVLI